MAVGVLFPNKQVLHYRLWIHTHTVQHAMLELWPAARVCMDIKKLYFAGLQRCGKSCRLRWINYLRPDLKRGTFSQQEEDLIVELHGVLGNRYGDYLIFT